MIEYSNRFSQQIPITSPSFTSNTFDKLFANRITWRRISVRVQLILLRPSIYNLNGKKIVQNYRVIEECLSEYILTYITSSPRVESFFNNSSPNDLKFSSIICGSGPPYKTFSLF